MTKKATKLQKINLILKDAFTTQWCYVDTENEFNFNDTTYVIHKSVDEYRVHNKAGEIEDYTNESYMEEILVVVDTERKLHFYNQNYGLVENKFIRIKE